MTLALEKYTETERDQRERELYNRRELIAERRTGMEIFIYWLRETNTISVVLVEQGREDREFEIPNDSVLDAKEHPEYYASKADCPRATRPHQEGGNA